MSDRRPLRLPFVVGASAALFAAAAVGVPSAHAAGGKLTLVAYSTPQEVYEKLIPAFQKTPAGKGWSFDQSYGASGDQSRAVDNGLAADVVAFSLEPDITRLVNSGLVNGNWNRNKFGGIVSRSVVVFAVRKGNPKGIRSWADLTKPGVQVLTPNFQTSGGAKWNILAAYGAQLQQGKSDADAQNYLRALYKNVVVQDKSAREALNTFNSGKGDVLLAYENEALFAQREGVKLDYVVPKETILIENPIAAIQTSPNRRTAQAFVDFTRTAPAQTVFGQLGYRPVLGTVARRFAKRYPRPAKLFTIAKFGGWNLANKRFFDTSTGIVSAIQRGG